MGTHPNRSDHALVSSGPGPVAGPADDRYHDEINPGLLRARDVPRRHITVTGCRTDPVSRIYSRTTAAHQPPEDIGRSPVS